MFQSSPCGVSQDILSAAPEHIFGCSEDCYEMIVANPLRHRIKLQRNLGCLAAHWKSEAKPKAGGLIGPTPRQTRRDKLLSSQMKAFKELEHILCP